MSASLEPGAKVKVTKDPDAVLDYTFDWTAWLTPIADTIQSHVVTVDGVTLDSSSISGTTVIAWISGGTLGTNATVTCQITTAAGRTDERHFMLKIAES